jgi:outer membrane protein assembly factor BamB
MNLSKSKGKRGRRRHFSIFPLFKTFSTGLFLLLFLWATKGCSPTETSLENLSPVVQISSVTSAKVGQTVELDGSQSYDPDGDAISFTWRQVSGPANVSLNNARTAKAAFTPQTEGTYRFSLSVNDGETASEADKNIEVSALPFAETPVFNPAEETFFRNTIEVTISSKTSDADIYYTTDGSEPAALNGVLYTQPICLSDSCVLKAIAVHSDMQPSPIARGRYTRREITTSPTFDPADGTIFQHELEVSLTCKMDIATIYYTLDGSDPSAASGLRYTGPIHLTDTCEIKAMACMTDFFDSEIVAAKFIRWETVATPKITPQISFFQDSCDIELSCNTPGSVIYYTTNGKQPGPDYGNIYVGPFTITASATIHALACHDEMFPSEMITANYTRLYPVAKPVFTPAGGSKFQDDLEISISCETDDATIRYTLDGSDPSSSNGFTYTEPITLSKTTQIRAMACKYAMIDSSIVSADYTKVICGLSKWSYPTGGVIDSSPAVGADGTIYVGSYDRKIYAIRPTGSLKWSYTTGGSIFSSPALSSEGNVYISSMNGLLYAISAGGTLLWTYNTGKPILASPAVAANGTIYINNASGLFALTPSGNLKWQYATTASGSYTYSSPAIGSDGTIYVGTIEKLLHAVNPNGTRKWTFETSSYIDSSPAIDSDGTIYVGSGDQKLWAINADGTQKWFYKTGGYIDSSPVIGSDGTIYIGSADTRLYAITAAGRLKWSLATGGKIHATPLLGSDGIIYITALDGMLYAVKPDGSLKWSFAAGGGIESSPALGNAGLLYFGSKDGRLYAITASGQIATSSWPKFHRNLRQTGCADEP